jgi:hypothetical protein
MTEKSILEQALLQVQTLEEAVKQNAKGILASTMKQELNDLLKESMEDEEDVAEQPTPEEEEADDMSDEGADEEGAEVADDEENLDNEMPAGFDSEGGEDLDSEEGEDDEFSSESEEDENPFEDEEDAMDMTGASDEEVMKVFKAMKPEDGIIVKKDGDSVHFSDGDNDYIIKLDNEMGEEIAEDEMSFDQDDMAEGSDMSYDEDMMEDEVIYEIELDEEEEEEIEEASHEEDMEEAARTKSNVHGNKGGQDRAGLDSKKKYKAGSGAINEDVEKLKRQNGEYKKALVLFKEKLNEVAVFNANLAYSTRLFTEHSTTKQEKLNILKRFDGINNMNESKALFNTIKNELDRKSPITETVANKISNTPTTSSSKEMLAESKAYENPQFKRMKDLMSKIK